MSKIYILKLRLKKWWQTKVVSHIWPDLPFQIAYTTKVEGQFVYQKENLNNGDILITLAEFDVAERHYLIYK